MRSPFGKTTERGSSSVDAVEDSMPSGPSDRFGLHQLADTSQDQSGEGQYPVDIIAVHGLNGDSFTTWTHPNGSLWLRDFLPQSLPGCRVFTFGYPSQVFSKSTADVKGFAHRLKRAISDIPDVPGQETRPIIFLCHCLGGIVCKQALVSAHENHLEPDNQKLLQSVTGVVFFATPHGGSATANLAGVLSTIINGFLKATSVGLQAKTLRTDLLSHLESDSKALQNLAESAVYRLADLQIVSFYETEPEPPMRSVIVDKQSATLKVPSERIHPLCASNRSICRFPSQDGEYSIVLSEIRRVAQAAPSPLKRTRTASSQELTWDESAKSCMSLFSKFDIADYRMALPVPAKGTCHWILGHASFLSWLDKAGNVLLWLTGHPGSGKTMLASFLAQHLETLPASGPARNVCVYFCDDKISRQRDASGILTGLIFQIIVRYPSLARHLSKLYQIYGRNIVRSFTALWTLFKNILMDPASGPAIIIIDALDECEEATRRSLLRAIKLLVQDQARHAPGAHGVKFVLVSRPLAVEHMIDRVSELRIHIDDCGGGRNGDFQIYIRQRLDEILEQRHLHQELRQSLQELLYAKSGQTFLWLHMVLAALEDSPLLSYSDLKAAVERIPPDLETMYVRSVSDIHAEHLGAASKLLKLILGSSRALSLDEINIAFSISPDHHTTEEVTEACQIGMQRTMYRLLGQLARVSDAKVSLVHQSAKDFLQRNGANDKLPPALRAIREEDCALAIATACIDYLLLDDFADDCSRLVDLATTSSFDVSKPSAASHSSSSDNPVCDETLEVHNLPQGPPALDEATCQLLSARYPLYGYAALHWTEHFARCEASAPARLRAAAKRLLLDGATAHCTNWLRFRAGARSIPPSTDRVVLAAFFNLDLTLADYLGGDEPVLLDTLDDALFCAAEQGHDRIADTLRRAGADPTRR